MKSFKTTGACFIAVIFASIAHAETLPLYVEEGLSPNERVLLDNTLANFRSKLPDLEIVRHEVSSQALEKKLGDGKKALFVASSFFFRQQMRPYKTVPISFMAREEAEEPNHSVGSLVLVRNEDLKTLSFADLKDKKVAFSSLYGTSGLYPAFDLIPSTENPHKWFSELRKISADYKELLDILSRKQVDAVILPACLMETVGSSNDNDGFRPLSTVARSSIGCFHTSSLYPGAVLGATSKVSPEEIALLSSVVYSSAGEGTGFSWSYPSDFTNVDGLLSKLGLDDYTALEKSTWKSVLKNNAHWVFLAVLVLLLVLFQSAIVNILVKKRTKQLVRVMNDMEQMRLREKKAARRVEELQKVGVVGLMSSLITHEIRQPVSAIRCWCYTAKKLVKIKAAPEEVEKVLDDLNKQLLRIDEIIENIRSYARSQKKEEKIVLLSEVVKKAVASIKSDSTVLFSVSGISRAMDVPIKVEPFEMELVLINLFRNSLQAQQGKEAAYVELGVKQEPGQVKLIITDGGPPVDPDVLKNIKTPFFSSKKEGMGLGLAVVNSVLLRYRGQLLFSLSKENKLIVEIVLPKADQPEEM